jgi:Papain family cysteine protease
MPTARRRRKKRSTARVKPVHSRSRRKSKVTFPTGIASPNNAVVVTDASGEDHGLGHVFTHDDRDFDYPMSPHLGEIDVDPMTQTQVYALGPILDQGKTQSCVGHAWTLFVTSAPRLTQPGPDPYRIYHEAQQLDDTPGQEPIYYGTSVRAGAQAMLKDNWISGDYVWAEDVRVLWQFILTRGPVVMASNWYTGMSQPDKNGFVSLKAPRMGGHCYFCYGVSADDRAFVCANSWGTSWGLGGTFLLRYEHARQLFFEKSMAACSAIETS